MKNDKRTGAIRGLPQRFIKGHSVNLKYRSPKKKCGGCKIKLPRTIEYFATDSRNKDGLSWRCHSCLAGMTDELERRKKRIKAYLKKYRRENSEKAKAYAHSWREENLEYSREQHRQWGLKNFASVRENAKRKRHLFRKALAEGKATRRAKERNAVIGDVDFDRVYDAHRGICGICDKPVARDRVNFDHIVPIGIGPHTEDNLHPTHPKCNKIKGDRTLEYARLRVIELRKLGDDI